MKLILLLASLVATVSSFKEGAPSGVCDKMIPVHGNAEPQVTIPPFILTAVPSSRDPKRVWNVTVTGTKDNSFKGILLQSRTEPTVLSTIGSFTSIPRGFKISVCPDRLSTYITHSDPALKKVLSLEWKSPPNFEGDIFFVATVVQDYNTFWTGIKSTPVAVKEWKLESTRLPGMNMLSFEERCYKGCGVSKKCLASDSECIQNKNCTSFVSVSRAGGNYEFEMFSKESKYVAVGLSDDNKMGADSVIECEIGNSMTTPVNVFRSYNLPNSKANIRLDDNDQRKFQVLRSKVENGAIYCKLIHDPVIKIKDTVFDLDRKEYYLLLAAGSSLRDNGVGFHDITYIASSKKAKLDDLSPAKIENQFYAGCSFIKTCFGVPSDCLLNNDCKGAVSVSVKGSKYEFELLGNTAGYIAVGLSDDSKMGNDSVVECVNGEAEGNLKTVKLYMSYNLPSTKGNTRDQVSQEGVTLLNSSYEDGVLYCKFVRDEKTVVRGSVYDLKSKEYYLLLAAGSTVKSNGVGYHDILFSSASEKRLLSDISNFSEASKLFLRMHGAFMIFAWIGCASTGIIIARYFKKTWVERTLCGKDIWFAWHRFFMLLAWCLTIAAFIIIFVEIGEWVDGASQLHAILGCVTTVFALIQPIGAVFRPPPNAHNRPIFNWFHWFFGNTAYIFAIATIFLAVPLSKADLPTWFSWMLVPHVALYVITHFLLSVAECCRGNGNRVSSMSMKELTPGVPQPASPERRVDAPFGWFRKSLLCFYVVCTILLVAAMIVMVVFAPIDETIEMIRKEMNI